MVYYPYFRGKQFELIAIRESASLIAKSGFVPIIEPVRESLTSLTRTLAALAEAQAKAIVITNPRHGDLREDGRGILEMLDSTYPNDRDITAGVLLTSETSLQEAINELRSDSAWNPSLIHAGFAAPNELAAALQERGEDARVHVFIDDKANTLYRRHFRGSNRILVKDGFERMKNSAFPPLDNFSDLHATYTDFGMDGFGDFLTVGDFYSEGGGPAYAVAIHLTFVDATQDNTMRIYHFVSDSNDTPTDPAGKFAQALQKLIAALDTGTSGLLETSAITEFRELYERQHFPGLGHVKKLSMKHHMETLAAYEQSANA